ncbi:MAG: hypothetical protein AB7S26_00705 [Sandaracinaceae bacterium]
MARRILSSLALSGLAYAATWVAGCTCSPSPGCPVGTHGCPCDVGSTCSAGASCISGTCIDPRMDAAAVGRTDAGPDFIYRDSGNLRDAAPNPDAFFADDPPPMECLEDGTMRAVADPPGGTPECPDDKNREGCPCNDIGETAACWPGLRVNRNRGICRDGMTTCNPFDEFRGTWGPCVGAVLPVDGATRGPQACRCFSAGRWELDNLSPCFATYSPGGIYAVSTHPDTGMCPSLSTPPPTPPSSIWTADRLTVDCEGRFNLCYTLKAGSADAPSPSDCTVSRVCTGDFWYMTRDVVQELPPLPSWVGTDQACAAQFAASGGYGEMSVLGLSVECDAIDDGSGAEYVFNRVQYCPLSCSMTPTAPECMNCMRGGSGMF